MRRKSARARWLYTVPSPGAQSLLFSHHSLDRWRMLLRVMLLLPAVAASAAAQVPATPVLQNAFISPGLGLGANVAGGASESFVGAAVGWGFGVGGVLPSGGVLLSGAAGAHHANGSTRGGYGGRLAAGMSTNPSRPTAWGAGAFVGVGGSPRTRLN